MAQFDLRRNVGPGTRQYPYLLELQSDFLDGLSSRLVAAVTVAERHGKALTRLEIELPIEGRDCVILFTELASLSPPALGVTVLSLADRRDEFTAALDFLIHGY